MSILENTKKIWRRSLQKPMDSVHVADGNGGKLDEGDGESLKEPITLAVIGCGQRGKVRFTISTSVRLRELIAMIELLCLSSSTTR